LSVEHHHGLVQVKRIFKALDENLDLETELIAFMKEWTEVMQPHFEIEETILIPPYQQNPNHDKKNCEDVLPTTSRYSKPYTNTDRRSIS